MGSVKDLETLQKPTKNKLGLGRFYFSDRYSVFDWGKMPDEIPNKGKALCIIGAWFFEKLKECGIQNHYNGLVEGDKVFQLKDLKKPSSIMEIKLTRVVKPYLKNDNRYDYSIFSKEEGNFLIPLEIIFRNYLPENSSLVQRIKKGVVLLSQFGLTQIPPEDKPLDKPILDYSTKLEPTDRYILEREALEISGLKEKEFDDLKNKTNFINKLITEEVSKLGLVHIDGKVEMAIDYKRNIFVVDVIGTPDECRFYLDHFHISKEVARLFYRKTDWFREINEAKEKDRENWKKIVSQDPPPLPVELKNGISELYCSFCNELTQREWFPKSESLKNVLKKIKEILN